METQFPNTHTTRPQWVNSWWHSDGIMLTQLWVNTGSGNGLLPDGTKLIPEPTLIYPYWGLVEFTWGQFIHPWFQFTIYLSMITGASLRHQWVNDTEVPPQKPNHGCFPNGAGKKHTSPQTVSSSHSLQWVVLLKANKYVRFIIISMG